jgi:hypothetical protein
LVGWAGKPANEDWSTADEPNTTARPADGAPPRRLDVRGRELRRKILERQQIVALDGDDDGQTQAENETGVLIAGSVAQATLLP